MTRKRLSRVIRIFISSTFTDMERERALLHKFVFPAIKKICNDRDWRFETIDLRWGITAEEAYDNRTVDICLNEIKHSRLISPRPNFIILAGQRYGWIPLPGRLPEDTYLTLLQNVSPKERSLIERLYILDTNSIAPIYILKKGIETSKDAAECRIIMERFASSNIEFEKSFFISATESEIYEGLFREPDLKNNVLLYVRHLTDIPPENTAIFCQNELRQLDLNQRLRNYVSPSDSIFLDTTFNQYSRGEKDEWFVSEMISLLSRQVTDEMVRHQKLDSHSEEVLIQKEEIALRTMNYPLLCGTDEIVISTIKHNHVTVINGNGTNDTGAMAAHIAQTVPNCIIRFAGISQLSDSAESILKSILYELSDNQDNTRNGLTLYKESAQTLAAQDKQLTLIIANIDRLVDRDILLSLLWLPPASKAPQIKTVLLSEDEPLNLSPSNDLAIVDLPHTDPAAVRKAVYELLHKKGRRLDEAQTAEANCLIDNNCKDLPQNIDLIVQNLQHLQCGDDVDSLSVYPFSFWAEICSAHNNYPLFARLALALISGIPGGVTDNEILEILSSDNELFTSLNEAFGHKIISGDTVCAIPMSLWSKLYFQMGPVLSTSAGVGTSKNRIACPSSTKSLRTFLGNEIYSRVFRLAKNYFISPERFDSYRATELLPTIMLLLNEPENATALLCNDSFCNRKIGLGMIDGLKNDFIVALATTPRQELKTRLDFVNSESPTLIQYCPLSPRFFKRQFSYFLEESQTIVGQYQIQRRKLLRLIRNAVIAASENYLLIVENDETIAQCTLYDMITMRPVRSIEIALEEYIIMRAGKIVDRGFSPIKEAALSPDGCIAGMTCAMGRAIKWRIDATEIDIFPIEPDDFGDAHCSSPIVIGHKVAFFACHSNSGESIHIDANTLFSDPHYPRFEKLYPSGDPNVLYAVSDKYLKYLIIDILTGTIKTIKLNDSTLTDWAVHIGYNKTMNTLYYRGSDEYFPIGAMNMKNKTITQCNGQYKPSEYIFSMYSSASFDILIMALKSKIIIIDNKTKEILGNISSTDSDYIKLLPLNEESLLCIGKDITHFHITVCQASK